MRELFNFIFVCVFTSVLISCGGSSDTSANDLPPKPLSIVDLNVLKVNSASTVQLMPAIGGGLAPLTYEWSQKSGIPVTIIQNRWPLQFTAPSVFVEELLTFSVSVTDSAGAYVQSIASVNILPTTEYDPIFDVGNSFIGASVTGIESSPSIQSNPVFIANVDIDNDNDNDLIVTSFTWDDSGLTLASPIPEASVYSLINDGGGIFTLRIENSAFEAGTGLHIADFNEDGFPDAFITGAGQEYADPKNNGEPVSFLLSQGDGTFSSLETGGGINTYYSPGPFAFVSDMGDINNDGHMDVVVGDYHNRSGNGMYAFFYGNGDGTFNGPVNLTPGAQGPQSSSLTDMTGDGYLDFVIGGGDNPSLFLYVNDQTGAFGSPITLPHDSTHPNAVKLQAMDFNGDNLNDLVVFRIVDGVYGGTHWRQMLLNLGNTEFIDVTSYAAPFQTPLPNGGEGIEVIDVDNDGDLDLFFPLTPKWDLNNEKDIWLNNGTGLFRAFTFGEVDQIGDFGRKLLDVNGDGLVDAIEISDPDWRVSLQLAQ